jgi:hypothetical protein
MQGVRKRVEVLEFSNLEGKLKNCCCKRVHRVEGPNNHRLFANATKDACKNHLEILEFVRERLGRKEP